MDVRSEKMHAETLAKRTPNKTPSRAGSRATILVTPSKSLRTPQKHQTPRSVSSAQTLTPKPSQHGSQKTLQKPTSHKRAKSGTREMFTYAKTRDAEYYSKLQESQNLESLKKRQQLAQE